eukprot:1161050-Pelagomonas_calceolata.AAC.6
MSEQTTRMDARLRCHAWMLSLDSMHGCWAQTSCVHAWMDARHRCCRPGSKMTCGQMGIVPIQATSDHEQNLGNASLL